MVNVNFGDNQLMNIEDQIMAEEPKQHENPFYLIRPPPGK